jgi:hypothetical protein
VYGELRVAKSKGLKLLELLFALLWWDESIGRVLKLMADISSSV